MKKIYILKVYILLLSSKMKHTYSESLNLPVEYNSHRLRKFQNWLRNLYTIVHGMDDVSTVEIAAVGAVTCRWGVFIFALSLPATTTTVWKLNTI